MNNIDPHSDEPLDRLFAKARACPPDTTPSEYALEIRVLARIRERRDRSRSWSLSWKLMPFFAAIVLAAALWEQQAVQTANDLETLAFDPNPQSISLWDGLN